MRRNNEIGKVSSLIKASIFAAVAAASFIVPGAHFAEAYAGVIVNQNDFSSSTVARYTNWPYAVIRIEDTNGADIGSVDVTVGINPAVQLLAGIYINGVATGTDVAQNLSVGNLQIVHFDFSSQNIHARFGDIVAIRFYSSSAINHDQYGSTATSTIQLSDSPSSAPGTLTYNFYPAVTIYTVGGTGLSTFNPTAVTQARVKEDCGITAIDGCIINGLVWAFYPSATVNMFADSPSLASTTPFAQIWAMKTVWATIFSGTSGTSTGTTTLDIQIAPLGLATTTLHAGALQDIVAGSSAQDLFNQIRDMIKYLLWTSFAFAVFKFALKVIGVEVGLSKEKELIERLHKKI